MTALAEIRDAPGLDAYLEDLEERLEQAVGAYRGVVAEVGAEALAAGGKRLRPQLVYLSTPPGAGPPVIAGVAVELVHLATLMHDDLIDGARLRRGHASAWSAHGPEAARAAGDYLFARAFAELSATADARALAILANATLCLARGEAMQRRQRFDPDTTIEVRLDGRVRIEPLPPLHRLAAGETQRCVGEDGDGARVSGGGELGERSRKEVVTGRARRAGAVRR